MGRAGLRTPVSFSLPVVPKLLPVGSGSYLHPASLRSKHPGVCGTFPRHPALPQLFVPLDGGLPAGPQCSMALDPVKALWRRLDGTCIFWAPPGCNPHASLSLAVNNSPMVPYYPHQVLCLQQVVPLPALLPETKAATLFSPGKSPPPNGDFLQPDWKQNSFFPS